MNVFFDNCTAPVLAATLDGFISHYGHRAFHIRDIDGLKRGRHSSDMEWIEFLKHAQENWLFISGDARLLKNGAERAALRSAGLHGFILASAYQKTEMNQVAATIVWQWPRIEQFTKLFSPPAIAEIPINRIGKFRQLPL